MPTTKSKLPLRGVGDIGFPWPGHKHLEFEKLHHRAERFPADALELRHAFAVLESQTPPDVRALVAEHSHQLLTFVFSSFKSLASGVAPISEEIAEQTRRLEELQARVSVLEALVAHDLEKDKAFDDEILRIVGQPRAEMEEGLPDVFDLSAVTDEIEDGG